jgi:hypothetical protein
MMPAGAGQLTGKEMDVLRLYPALVFTLTLPV